MESTERLTSDWQCVFRYHLAAMNDVYVSNDVGVTWSLVTANAGWSPRFNHASTVITPQTIVVTGGGSSSGISILRIFGVSIVCYITLLVLMIIIKHIFFNCRDIIQRCLEKWRFRFDLGASVSRCPLVTEVFTFSSRRRHWFAIHSWRHRRFNGL
jgi:hypothetical protein